jgi:enterochelin esterase-like enzyme
MKSSIALSSNHLLWILILIWISAVSCVSEISGQVPERVEKHSLPNGLTIDVYLPPGYDKEIGYPVLIFNDGEFIFDQNAWNMSPLLDQLIISKEINPIIGIAVHTGGKRNDWYIPYQDLWIQQNWGEYTPSAHKYAEQLLEEVIPFVQQHYSVNDSETGIIGASLGGLISTWTGIHYPEHFKYSASLSGSFWVDDHHIFDEAADVTDHGQTYWFDIGTGEWNYYVPLFRILDDVGFRPGSRNFYYEVPNGKHIASDWLNRIEIPLKVFYGTDPDPLPEALNVHLECIPSKSVPGKKFRRLNPVVTLSNGVKYSLAHTASYTVIQGEVEIGTDGSIQNNPNTLAEILVKYGSLSGKIAIPYGWCK